MTPLLEVAHVRRVVSIGGWVQWLLPVVPHVGNDGGNVTGLDTGSDVLAIASTTRTPIQGLMFDRDRESHDLQAVSPNAGLGGLLGIARQSVVPS